MLISACRRNAELSRPTCSAANTLTLPRSSQPSRRGPRSLLWHPASSYRTPYSATRSSLFGCNRTTASHTHTHTHTHLNTIQYIHTYIHGSGYIVLFFIRLNSLSPSLSLLRSLSHAFSLSVAHQSGADDSRSLSRALTHTHTTHHQVAHEVDSRVEV